MLLPTALMPPRTIPINHEVNEMVVAASSALPHIPLTLFGPRGMNDHLSN